MQHDGYLAAAQRVVDFLQTQSPMHAWVVADIDEQAGDWIPVAVADRGYGVPPGTRLRWTDTVCWRMVRGTGAQVVTDLDDDPRLGAAPVRTELPISAYVGAPITVDGRLLGTLCGFDPQPMPPELAQVLPLVEMLADLLAHVHEASTASRVEAARADEAEAAAMRDPLTGVLSRFGWLTALDRERERCQRDGGGLAFASLDCDGLKDLNDRLGHASGDVLLTRVATALQGAVRRTDVLARLGGDEFGVLSPAAGPGDAEQLAARLQAALRDEQVQVSVGAAWWDPSQPVETAWGLADRRMYRDKRARKFDQPASVERNASVVAAQRS